MFANDTILRIQNPNNSSQEIFADHISNKRLIHTHRHTHIHRLSRWLSGKGSACNAGDTGDAGSIPGSERSPGGGNGNPLQYVCLKNPMDREAWQATVQTFGNN